MKDIAYYTTVGALPRKEDYKKYHVYHKGQTLYSNVSVQQATLDRKGWQDNGYTIEADIDEDGYRVARQEYNNKRNQLMTEFRDDLFKENGVANHPKAQKAYDIAYRAREDGGGLQAVIDMFEELAELLK